MAISGSKSGVHHDGRCLPCLIRRAACLEAETVKYDAKYLHDGFDLGSLGEAARLLLADHLRFCTTVDRLPDHELLTNAPDFSLHLPAVDPKRLADTFGATATSCSRPCGSTAAPR